MVNNDVKSGPVRGPAAVSRVASASAPAGVGPEAREAPGARASGLRLLDMARAVSHQSPPVDGTRVADLRHAIAQGSFQVDPAGIAQAIIARLGGIGSR